MHITMHQLGEIATLTTGHPHRKWKEDARATHRLLTIRAIDESRLRIDDTLSQPFTPQYDVGAGLLRTDDVVVATRGERRKAGVVGKFAANDPAGPLVASEQLAILRPVPNVFPYFLALVLNSPAVQRQIADVSRGTHISFVSLSDLAKLSIPVPPVEEQRRLAELHRLLATERDLMARLTERRSALLNALINQITIKK